MGCVWGSFSFTGSLLGLAFFAKEARRRVRLAAASSFRRWAFAGSFLGAAFALVVESFFVFAATSCASYGFHCVIDYAERVCMLCPLLLPGLRLSCQAGNFVGGKLFSDHVG